MRPQHTSHTLGGFPVYSSSFLSSTRLVLGGGGGQGKTGVKNQLRLYDVSKPDMELTLVGEYEFEAGEDAPMSMAVDSTNETIVCGANSSQQAMEAGKNMHCRLFSVQGNKIDHLKSVQAMTTMTGDPYQKVTVLSPSNDVVAIGTTNNDVHLLHYPSLSRAAPVLEISAGELFDISFSAASVAIASSTNIFIYNLHEDKAPHENILKAKNPAASPDASGTNTPVEQGKGIPSSSKSSKKKKPSKSQSGANGVVVEAQLESLELATTLVRPKLPKNGSAITSFRAVRYHPNNWTTLYAVLNSTSRGSRVQRKAHIVKYEWTPKLRTWTITGTCRIGEGSITCFEISGDGAFLAYGASDCSIGIVDSRKLSPLLKILGAHEFPSTTLRFNTDRSLLVSCSADNSVRIVTVPEKFDDRGSTTLVVFVALLSLLLAVLTQLYFQGYLNPAVLSATTNDTHE
ncbi:hypothetical protein FRC14_003828 [Serendipita sp. 396]|nr:hypothetical protein FRC14_003828 [Serendipita sp. 396]KAG8789433.1 hypothetical protein FRC15_008290 [Serendipita sp. 397]KAG8879017.1 hypothetical protein FRC20_003776 [Serendipita sp. 405]KAG9054372.1 hypothetical protein FS842_005345 [Serendipita sp. 407]